MATSSEWLQSPVFGSKLHSIRVVSVEEQATSSNQIRTLDEAAVYLHCTLLIVHVA